MRWNRTGSTFVLLVFLAGMSAAAGSQALALDFSAADQAWLRKKIKAQWNITGHRQIEAANARGIDILEDHPDEAQGYFTIMVDEDELDGLRKDGFDIDVLDRDVHASFAAKGAMTMNGFLTWAEMISKLDSLHAAFPTLTTARFSLGVTVEDRDLWAMKISDNPDVDENEPEILFTGVHHAREPIGLEINIHTMRTLLFGYGTDPVITNLVNEREIYFVPCVNPDGYVWNEALIGAGQSPNWRKNRRPNAGGSTGVDPNRNYGYNWGYDNIGSSPTAGSETYRGTGPFSEFENQHIRDFVNSREFVIAVNFHSYSNLYLWPPGYDQFYVGDQGLFQAIGDSVATFNGCVPQAGWALYVTNGDSDDWMYFDTALHPKILSFTPEVGTSSDNFWPSVPRIPILVNQHVPANLVFIELADTPERILPPVPATWVGPGTVGTPDYTLDWSDAGGPNAAVSFELSELFGPQTVIDGAESGTFDWDLNIFSASLTRAANGEYSYHGGAGNGVNSSMTGTHYFRPDADDTLRANVYYDIEPNWDYAYVEVSTDHGGTWNSIPGNITTTNNINGTNRGHGITGVSLSAGDTNFVAAKFGLSPFAGQDILIRLAYSTDGFDFREGVYFDDITPVMHFDSMVVLEPALATSDFPVTGKLPGNYHYSVVSTDATGDVSAPTPPHTVTVDYVTCDCNCHADPECNGAPDIVDVGLVINIAFRGAEAIVDGNCPHDPAGRTDVDCSGATDIVDVSNMINVAFRGTSPAAVFCDPCTP